MQSRGDLALGRMKKIMDSRMVGRRLKDTEFGRTLIPSKSSKVKKTQVHTQDDTFDQGEQCDTQHSPIPKRT